MNREMTNVTPKVKDLAQLILGITSEPATAVMADEYFTQYGKQVASEDLLSAMAYNEVNKFKLLQAERAKPVLNQTITYSNISQEMLDKVDVGLAEFKQKWQGTACFFDTGGWGAPADKYGEVRADWCKTIKTLKDDNISTNLLAAKFDLSERSIQRIVRKLSSADGW